MPRNLPATAALALLLAARVAAAVVYVDAAASGPVHNGLSWATAYTTITAAISSLTYGGEVWIRAGTYRECVTVSSCVTLYGGYLGSETATSPEGIGRSLYDFPSSKARNSRPSREKVAPFISMPQTFHPWTTSLT